MDCWGGRNDAVSFPPTLGFLEQDIRTSWKDASQSECVIPNLLYSIYYIVGSDEFAFFPECRRDSPQG